MLQLTRPAHPLTRPWLLLAIGAIGVSALLAILLVVARTPLLQQLFGGADLFHTVLVLHVNFSVLIWLLAFGAVLWSLELPAPHPWADTLALALVCCGVLLLGFSPLITPPPQPVMSNYIPILHSPAFLTGLCAFSAGIGLAALRRLAVGGARTGQLAALSLLASLLVFAVTAWRLPHPIDNPQSFEALFWGGGHMLQFTYLLLLTSAWQRLQSQGTVSLPEPAITVPGTLLLGIGVLLTLLFEPGSEMWREAFTWLMRLGTPLLALSAIARLWQPRHQGALRWSQLLLLAGLLLGATISGDNVTVTAHYHATNAAITLAFMALAYRLFSALGMGVPHLHWSQRQLRLYVYGMGLYIGGMALSGLLDVPRKVPLSIDGIQAVTMGLMGLGGIVAIVATLLFVALLWQAVRRHTRVSASHRGAHEVAK